MFGKKAMPNTATAIMERHRDSCRKIRETLLAEHAPRLHADALCLARVLARQGTVFVCGSGDATVQRAARHLADALADGHALQRPALPVISLDGDIFRLARRLTSLGMNGDALLLLHRGTEKDAEPLLYAARSTGMHSVCPPCSISDPPEMPPFAVATLLFALTDAVARLVEYHLFENTSALSTGTETEA